MALTIASLLRIFVVLDNVSNELDLLIQLNLVFPRDRPTLNQQNSSTPFFFFNPHRSLVFSFTFQFSYKVLFACLNSFVHVVSTLGHFAYS